MYTWIFDLSGSSNVHVSHRDRTDEDMHGATTWSRGRLVRMTGLDMAKLKDWLELAWLGLSLVLCLVECWTKKD
ncbi:unnamed protein product [Prunus armeniaca]